MREFLIFYSSFYESAQYLPEADKLKFYEAVIEYGLGRRKRQRLKKYPSRRKQRL